MALFKFVEAIYHQKPLEVYNKGQMIRDFTYIEDIVEGIFKIMHQPPRADVTWDGHSPNPATSYAPYRIYNIGNNKPEKLLDFIKAIEHATGLKAQLNLLPMQPGDVPETCADVSALERDFDYKPNTTIEHGIGKFVAWYQQYYRQ